MTIHTLFYQKLSLENEDGGSVDVVSVHPEAGEPFSSLHGQCRFEHSLTTVLGNFPPMPNTLFLSDFIYSWTLVLIST